jgi:CubicO group peptidase (beta-lactamase class C family)
MIDGTTDPRFAAVRDAFASCFTDGLQQGGAVAVMLDGRIVADLWGGHADAAGTRPWARDTLVNVWSSTKGIVSLAMAQLVARGKLHYDRPVAAAWPEFAAGGKAAITLDLVLSHRSGLDGLSVPMTIEQVYAWTPYVDALAAMAPLWEPGSRFMYHALSFGHLAGEPLRRVDGRSVGRYVAEEIAGPLGVPFYIGLPDSEDHRVAELIAGPGSSDWVTFNLASPYPHSCRNPDLVATQPNDRAWRAAEMPGVNGHADARAMATIYGTLAADPTPLLPRAAIDEATRLRFEGLEANTGTPTAFGAGFCLRDPDYGRRASARSYGHTGWGGTFAFADPEARLGFAYVTNTMLGFGDSLDPRRQRLVDAVYDRL